MLLREELAADVVVLRSPRLQALDVPHAFGTRRRGAPGAEDDRALLGAAQLDGRRLVRIHQVHGALVHRAGAGPEGAELPRADALVSNRPGDLLRVVSADCVPILVSAAEGSEVAALHAGWRGLLAGVIPATLAAMGRRAAVAAVGPCLSPPRFEVGPEVAAAFVAAGHGARVAPGRGDRSHVDLRGVALDQLCAGGLAEVDVSADCTWEQADLFHSHRRDVTHGGARRTGLQVALIGPR